MIVTIGQQLFREEDLPQTFNMTNKKKFLILENAKTHIASAESWGLFVSPNLIKDIEGWVEEYLRGELDVFDINAYIMMKITYHITKEMKAFPLFVQCGDVDCIFKVRRPHGFGGQWWWCDLDSIRANPQNQQDTPESLCLSIDEVMRARKRLNLETWGVRR